MSDPFPALALPRLLLRCVWAGDAAAENRRLVLGRSVRLEYDAEARDRYGRLLAYVYLRSRFVNASLVELGYARTMSIPPNTAHAGELASLERRAASGEVVARESQVLRLDMDSVASRVQELERECSSMRRAIKKIDRSPRTRSADGSRTPPATAGWRARHGCKFSTQVCDSHARNVVASNRASRMGMSP